MASSTIEFVQDYMDKRIRDGQQVARALDEISRLIDGSRANVHTAIRGNWEQQQTLALGEVEVAIGRIRAVIDARSQFLAEYSAQHWQGDRERAQRIAERGTAASQAVLDGIRGDGASSGGTSGGGDSPTPSAVRDERVLGYWGGDKPDGTFTPIDDDGTGTVYVPPNSEPIFDDGDDSSTFNLPPDPEFVSDAPPPDVMEVRAYLEPVPEFGFESVAPEGATSAGTTFSDGSSSTADVSADGSLVELRDTGRGEPDVPDGEPHRVDDQASTAGAV
ncbi:MAG: hypothetical protein ACRCY9_09665 [Phycicoccus sp.]